MTYREATQAYYRLEYSLILRWWKSLWSHDYKALETVYYRFDNINNSVYATMKPKSIEFEH